MIEPKDNVWKVDRPYVQLFLNINNKKDIDLTTSISIEHFTALEILYKTTAWTNHVKSIQLAALQVFTPRYKEWIASGRFCVWLAISKDSKLLSNAVKTSPFTMELILAPPEYK